MKDKIVNCLMDKLDNVYCYNCKYEKIENDQCEDCYRKNMMWEISEGYAEIIANSILNIVKDDNCNKQKKYSTFMINNIDKFKIDCDVRVVDDGYKYTTFISMAEALVDNYNLNKDVLYKYIENKNSDTFNEKGVILAMGKHIHGDDDILALVSLDYDVILISINGLELL